MSNVKIVNKPIIQPVHLNHSESISCFKMCVYVRVGILRVFRIKEKHYLLTFFPCFIWNRICWLKICINPECNLKMYFGCNSIRVFCGVEFFISFIFYIGERGERDTERERVGDLWFVFICDSDSWKVVCTC